MSPLDFGPSDVKNPTHVAYVQVPESYWINRCLVFAYEGLFTDPADFKKAAPVEGLVDFCKTAKRLNIRLGLYSSLDDAVVVGTLSSFGVADCFDSIRCQGDVEAPPPSGDLYRITLETLGVSADRVVDFEATDQGAAYAKSQGVFTVAVERGQGAPRGADYYVKDFSKKTLLDLMNDIDDAQRSVR